MTSANIVGYQEIALPAQGVRGSTAATFVNVANGIAGGVKLGDIKPKNVGSGTYLMLISSIHGGTRELTLDEVEAFGWTQDYFDGYEIEVLQGQFYYNENGEGGAGWYFFDDAYSFINMNDWVIPYGAGVVVSSADDNASLVYSGEVNAINYDYPLPGQGARGSIANACPVAKTMADFVPNGLSSGSTYLMLISSIHGGTRELTLDEVEAFGWTQDYFDGYEIEVLQGQFYYNENGEGGAGWYFFDDAYSFINMNDWIIASGEALVVSSSDDGASITLPKAL